MVTITDFTLRIGANFHANGYVVHLADTTVVLRPGPFSTLCELARARLLNPGGIAKPADFGLLDRDRDALYQRLSRLRAELNAEERGLGRELIMTVRGTQQYKLCVETCRIKILPDVAALCPPVSPRVVQDLLRFAVGTDPQTRSA
ncbi:MAG: hypothetical protein R3C59_09830 [Planctomycetaceae bacterium]